MVADLEEVFTPKEVAKALKLSEKTVLQYLREGRLPGFRVGKHWRVRRADLAALVQPARGPVLVTAVDQDAPRATADVWDPVQWKAAAVARMRELKAEGLSLQAIADRLYAEGVRTPTGKERWHKGTIGELLAAATAPGAKKTK